MTEFCKNCRKNVFYNKKSEYKSASGSYAESKLESDMKDMMLRMDKMQEMMSKILNSLPNVLPNQHELIEAMQVTTTPSSPVKSMQCTSQSSYDECIAKKAVMNIEGDDVMISESYVGEEQFKGHGITLKRLPSLILDQPTDTDSVGFISSTSCENSQDTCSDDMFHESFLEVAMKQMVADEELELLSDIDNVYHLENLHQTFPMLHQEELDAMEEQMKVNESYKEQLVKELKLVRLSMGVSCDFADVLEKLMDRELLHYYNWYGNQGKKSLQRYKIFNQLLREITVPPKGKTFDDIMHRALTVSHRRKNNQVYRKKRKIDSYYK
uniref:CSON007750 protein n=1 Tax=Culicoides sonorensis TaxID=179676 RepID=A0A336LAP8_CULSO